MNWSDLIGRVNEGINTAQGKERKRLEKIGSILEELQSKGLEDAISDEIQSKAESILNDLSNEEKIKQALNQLRKTLMEDHGFVPAHYHMTLGIGIGVGVGTALGVSFGIPFENGVVFGQMTGTTLGIVGGLLVGAYLDKKKEAEGKTIKSL